MTPRKPPRRGPLWRLYRGEVAEHRVTRAQLSMARKDLAASDDERRRLAAEVAAQDRVIKELSGAPAVTTAPLTGFSEADRAFLRDSEIEG